MPFKIEFKKGSPKPWRCVDENTGKDHGGSVTKEMAKKHLAALYANSPEAKKGK